MSKPAVEHGAPQALLGLALVAAGACLVTDKLEFGEDNVPANLRVVRPPSLSRVPPVEDPLCPLPSTPGSVALGRQQMGFEVEVFDANIADKLEARLFVNGNKHPSEDDVPTTGSVYRGLKHICVRKEVLNNPCNHVELVISRSFRGQGPYGVTDSTDLSVAEWWILPAAALNPSTTDESCAALVDAGVP